MAASQFVPEPNPTLSILKALRWIQRAEGLLAELERDPLNDPDVRAVRNALLDQLSVEKRRLRDGGNPCQSSSEKR